MPIPLDICQNDLLNALPPEEREQIFPYLEAIDMPLGKVIYESGGKVSHVYFPTTSIVSLLYAMENGSSAEIAIIGHEGIVGISLFMGAKPRPVERWCKVRVTLIDSRDKYSKKPFFTADRCNVYYYATPKHY